MSKSLLDIVLDNLLDSIFDAEWTGRHGEKLTERELKWVNLFGRKGKSLRNVYVPKGNGETSEIDLLYISPKGIFVFESKNYSGWIFGDERQMYWTASLPNGEKNRFYNPIKQNQTHLKWLRQLVGEQIPLYSIIVFSNRCTLKKVTVESNDIAVIQREQVYATVRKIWDHHDDVVPPGQVESLYERLKELTNVSDAAKAAHVERIRQQFKPSEPQEKQPENPLTTQAKDEVPTCPKCGGRLMLRTAKTGSHAGQQFYGCSNFPRCRYTKQG